MPEALAPVDANVSVPDVVKRAAAAAEAAHKAAYETPDPNPAVGDAALPDPTVQPAAPAPEPVPEPAPQPVPQPAPVAAQSDPDWEARYNSMKGRFEQSQRTIGSMQEQMSELGSELVRTQAVLRTPAMQQPQNTAHLTEEDVKTYGPELIDVTKRAALEAVEPRFQSLQNENQQLKQRLANEAQQRVFNTLDSEVPNWRDINGSDRFVSWCRLPDLYSGVIRGKLLNDALRTANAPRVISFFRGFLAEEVATGQLPAPQPLTPAQPAPARAAAVDLGSLAAPGKAKPATGASGVPADKPIITRAQIAGFYDQVRKGAYAGRDADRAADEAIIFAAQREGRVR